MFSNSNVLTINPSELEFNPLWVEKNVLNSWAYTCLLTEISVYGIIEPIFLGQGNVVIDGNKRLKAALDLKLDKVPFVVCREYSENDFVTKNIKPSMLVEILHILDKKYGLNSSVRCNKIGMPKVLISLRQLLFGGNTRVRQLYKLIELSRKIKNSYPIESKEIWDEMDDFEISLEQGILRMEELYQRRTTLNFSIDLKMTA